jgi:flagellar assembly protein FliH
MDQSFSTRPFSFETVFEAKPVIPEYEIDEELSAAVLRSEIDAMRASRAEEIAAAYARGAEEAEARVRGERDEALLAAFDALHAAWEEFEHTRDAMIEELRHQATELSIAIGETLAARALEQAPGAAIDEAIGRVLALVARGQEVLISVHPDLIEDITARIAARQSLDRRKLNLGVEGDTALAIGDAHLRWDGGGLSLSAEARAQAIASELASLRTA